MGDRERQERLEARKKLKVSSHQVEQLGRFDPKTIVAQLIQGRPPDLEKLKHVFEYLKAVKVLETEVKQMVGITSGTR